MLQFTRRRVLALLVLTCILLLTLDARGSSTIGSAKSTFVDVFSPLKGVGRMISNPVRNAWKGATSYDELERQNDLLREQLASQAGDSIAAQAALRDYQELVAQLDLPSLKDFTNVTAQVLSYSPTNVQQTIEINEGGSRGISVGMPVVNAAGLVGKVIEVYPNSSLVLLITDPSYSVTVRILGQQPIPGATPPSASPAAGSTDQPIDPVTGIAAVPAGTEEPSGTESVPTATTTPPTTVANDSPFGIPEIPDGVTVDDFIASLATTTSAVPTTVAPATTTTVDINKLPNRERGSLEGVGPDQHPVVRFLNNDSKANKIQVGDSVVTDGGSDSLAPSGLNVGEVSRITPRAGTNGPLVEVAPGANLSQINYVRVIMYLPHSEAPAG